MKFEIPFNADILRSQLELNFKLVWAKTIKVIKKYTILGSVFLSYGLFQVYNDTPSGYFLIGIGILLGCISLIYLFSYRKQKSITQNFISAESENNIECGECLI